MGLSVNAGNGRRPGGALCVASRVIVSIQCAKTFLKLMGQIAKDQTIQYILTMVDDMLQVRGHFRNAFEVIGRVRYGTPP